MKLKSQAGRLESGRGQIEGEHGMAQEEFTSQGKVYVGGHSFIHPFRKIYYCKGPVVVGCESVVGNNRRAIGGR